MYFAANVTFYHPNLFYSHEKATDHFPNHLEHDYQRST